MSNLLLQLSPQDSKFIKKMTSLSHEDRDLVEYVINATGVNKAAFVELTKIPRTELKSVKRLVQLYDDYKKGTTESKVIEFVKLITAMPLEMVTFWKKLLNLNDSELELINTYIQFCPTERTFASNFVLWYLKQTPLNFLTQSKGEEISYLESRENVEMEILGAEEKFKELFKKYILEQGNTVGKIVTRGVHSDEQCLTSCGEETIKVQKHLHKDKNASMEKKTYCISQSTEVGKLITKVVTKDKTCDKFENEKGRVVDTEGINAVKQNSSETEIPTKVNVDKGKFINRTLVDKIIMGNNKEQPLNFGHQDMNDLKPAVIDTDVSNNCSINYDGTTYNNVIASGSSQSDDAQNKDPDRKTSEISITDASKFSVYVMKVDGSNFIVRGKTGVSIPLTAEEFVSMDNKHHNTTDRPVYKNIDNEMNDPRKPTCASLFMSQPDITKISSNISQGNMNNLLVNSQTPKMPIVENNVLNSEKLSLNKTSDVNTGIVQAGTSKTRSCEFNIMRVREENCLETAQKLQKSPTQMVQSGLNVSQEKLRTYCRTSRLTDQNKTQVTASDTNTIIRSSILSSNNSKLSMVNTMQGDIAISSVNFDAGNSQANLSTVNTLQSSIMNLKENPSSNHLQREVANIYQTNAASIPSLPGKQIQAKKVLPNILLTENLSSATELQPQSWNVPQKDIGTSVKSNSEIASVTLPHNMSHARTSKTVVESFKVKIPSGIASNKSQIGIKTSVMVTSHITKSPASLPKSVSQMNIGNLASRIATTAIPNRMFQTGNGNSAVNTSQIATATVPEEISQGRGIGNSAVNTSQIATPAIPNKISQTGIGNSSVNTSQIATAAVSNRKSQIGNANSAINTPQFATTAVQNRMSQTGIRNASVSTSQIATLAVPKRMSQTGIGNSAVNASHIAMTAIPNRISQTEIGNSGVNTSQIATAAVSNRMSKTGNANSVINTSKIAITSVPNRMPQTGIGNASVSASQIATMAVPKTISKTSGIGNSAVKTSQIATTAIPNRMPQTGIGNATVSASQIATTEVPKTISQTSGIGNSAVKTSQIVTTAIPNRMPQTGIGNSSVSASQIATTAVPKTISQTDSTVFSNSHSTLTSQKNVVKSVGVLTPITISTIQPNCHLSTLKNTYVPVTVTSGTHANYIIGPIVQTATIVSSTIPTVFRYKPTISTTCSSISLSTPDASPTKSCTGILKSAFTRSTIPSVVNTAEPTKLVMHCDAVVKPSSGLLQAEDNTNKPNKTFIQCSEEPKARLLDVGVSPAISSVLRSGISAVGKSENPHTTVAMITMDNENKPVASFSRSQSKEEQIQKIPSATRPRPIGCLQKELISQVHHLSGIAKKIQKFQDEDVNDQHVFDRLMTQIKWFIPGYKVFRFHLEKFLDQIKGDSDICRTLTVYKKMLDRHIKMVSDFSYKYIAMERGDIIQKIVELMIMIREVKRQVVGINVNDFKEEGLGSCGCPYDPSLGAINHLSCCARVHGTAKDHESNKLQISNVENRSQSLVVKECSVALNDVKHILKNRTTIKCNEVNQPNTSEGQKFIVGSVTIPGNTQNFLGFRGFSEDEISCSKRKLCKLRTFMESDKKKRKIQKSGSSGNSDCSSNMSPGMEVLCSGDSHEDSSKDAVNDVFADAVVIKEENICVSEFNSVTVVSEDFNSTNCDEPMICVKQEDMGMEDPLRDNTVIKTEELVKTEGSEIEIEDHTITPSDSNQAEENSASQAKRQKGWSRYATSHDHCYVGP